MCVVISESKISYIGQNIHLNKCDIHEVKMISRRNHVFLSVVNYLSIIKVRSPFYFHQLPPWFIITQFLSTIYDKTLTLVIMSIVEVTFISAYYSCLLILHSSNKKVGWRWQTGNNTTIKERL